MSATSVFRPATTSLEEASRFMHHTATTQTNPKPVNRKRPQVLCGITISKKTGCGEIHIIINHDEYGIAEIFLKMGKAGGCAAAQTQVIGRVLTLAAKYHVPTEEVIKQLMGISCHSPVGHGKDSVLSCSDAVAKALRDYLEEYDASSTFRFSDDIIETPTAGACPECGSTMNTKAGKTSCSNCTFSR